MGSTLTQHTHSGIYLHAGPEYAISSTKTFTATIAAFALFALSVGSHRGSITADECQGYIRSLLTLPDAATKLLTEYSKEFERLGITYRYARNFLYLGRGTSYPIALEGAMKMKQVCLIFLHWHYLIHRTLRLLYLIR